MLFYLRIGEQHLILLGGEKRGEVDLKKKKKIIIMKAFNTRRKEGAPRYGAGAGLFMVQICQCFGYCCWGHIRQSTCLLIIEE